MRFAFIAKHRGIWPVSWLCGALGVSRSGFHAWLVRAPSARAKSDDAVGRKIKASFTLSDRTYGARRVWRDVLAEGVDCGLHRIERLMREQDYARRPRRRGLPKDHGDRSVVADNVWIASLSLMPQTRNGWPTSLISGLRKVGFMWQRSLTCFPDASWAGQ
jgi:putative transposase